MEIDKKLIGGVSMIAIVLYHLTCIIDSIWLSPFTRGYIGVDIFMFISGFGLCYSFNKNSLQTFYKHRLKKILPLYVLYAIFRSCMYILDGKTLTLWDWVCNLTSLSYYKIGGQFIEWYLCALLILYIVFPILYKVISKYKELAVISFAIFSIILLWLIRFPWLYDCFISRIPIFVLGIFFYVKRNSISAIVMAAFMIIGIISETMNISKFLTGAMICPLFILLIDCVNKYKNMIQKKIKEPICFIGSYTLDIYIANCMALTLCRQYSSCFSDTILIVIYFTINIAVSILISLINKRVQRFL